MIKLSDAKKRGGRPCQICGGPVAANDSLRHRELIRLAKERHEAHRRRQELGLSKDEVAFYEALEVNDIAVASLGDDPLR